MSMLDSMDDALLGVDDDEELDYDLEKEEEDALLADDPDNYDDENYDEIPDGMYANEAINEEESEVLEIDVNVALDEDLDNQNESKDRNIHSKLENDDPSDQEEEQQKERGRFTNERNNVVMHRTLSNEIPDSLEKINVQPFNNNNNNPRNGNNKFQRNNNNKNRFKNRPNNNRGSSVFGRRGILPMPGPPPLEDKNLGKTVLINPHFRGNVQVNENARLVWDAAQGGYPTPHQQRYSNPQMAQVAPFQTQLPQQSSPWIHPPYHLEQPNNYQGPAGSHEMIYNNQPHFNQSQGNFNNRDGRFNNPNTTMPPPLMSHPSPHFNQHTQPPTSLFPNRTFYNESLSRRQFPSQNNSPNNFDSNYSQTPNHAPHQSNSQNFNQQPPPYVQQQTYESGNEQHFTNQNHQGYSNQYGGAIPFQNSQPQQNFQSPTNLIQNQSNFEGFNSRPNQNQFQPHLQVQFNNNNNRAFNNNPSINNRVKNHHHHHQQQQQQQQQSINRPPLNFNQRTPPKRRPFENNKNQIELRDLPKKKKRSLELSNLHEVPTVDMPDTTTVEDKSESEDEEMKAYRLKIEEQKILREKILREKEERRKLAAAQKEAEEKLAASDSLITTFKTKPAVLQQQFNIQPVNAPGQAITTRINSQTLNQLNMHNQFRNIQNKANRGKLQKGKHGTRFNQNLAGPIIDQERNQSQINQNRPQPIQLVQNQQNFQVQPTRMVQSQGNTTRIFQQQQQQQQQQQEATIIISHDAQRIVMFNQEPSAQQQQQLQSAQRRVVLKSNGATVDGATLPETPVVVVSNLAAATTEPKIRKLCQGLGLVQNIEMIPNSRQATIRFKNVQSAHNFFKKYQRKIIDLSMIQVVLGQAIV